MKCLSDKLIYLNFNFVGIAEVSELFFPLSKDLVHKNRISS